MVEVTTDEKYVYWNKFGLENSDAQTPKEIGKNIEWFPNIPKMIFSKTEYKMVLEEFRKRLSGELEYVKSLNEIVTEYKLF
jgi:hypothetical protein